MGGQIGPHAVGMPGPWRFLELKSWIRANVVETSGRNPGLKVLSGAVRSTR